MLVYEAEVYSAFLDKMKQDEIRNSAIHTSLITKGFWSHDRFYTLSIEPTATWDRLYHLPAKIPAMEVPESSILAIGPTGPLSYIRTQNTTKLPENAIIRPEGDWDLVHRELMLKCQDHLVSC